MSFDNLSEFQNIISDSPRHPPASLWRFTYKNRYATQPLTKGNFLFLLRYYKTL